MKATRNEWNTMANLFRIAAEKIWEGGEPRPYGVSGDMFTALRHAAKKLETQISNPAMAMLAANKAGDIVREKLVGCDSMDQFLRRAGVPYKEITNLRLQTHKKAWFHRLAAECYVSGFRVADEERNLSLEPGPLMSMPPHKTTPLARIIVKANGEPGSAPYLINGNKGPLKPREFDACYPESAPHRLVDLVVATELAK